VEGHEDHVAFLCKPFRIKGFERYARGLAQRRHHLADGLSALELDRRRQLGLGMDAQKPDQFTTGIPDRADHTYSNHRCLLFAKNNQL